MKKIITIIMAIIIIFTSSMVFAETINPVKEAAEQGKKAGESAGKLDGEYAGLADFTSGKKIDFMRALPKNSEVEDKYNLKADDATYKSNFISQYRISFRLGYETAYRKASMEAITENNGIKHGLELGKASGAVQAMSDYENKLSNNWERSFKAFVKEASIDIRYNLQKEERDYAKNFRSSFEKGYREAYTFNYRTRNFDFEFDNLTTYQVSISDQEIQKSWPLYKIEGGKISDEPYIECKLQIKPGSIYEPTFINVTGIQHSFDMMNTRFKAASPAFEIRVWNSSGDTNFRKDIKLSFTFAGSEKVGIYKLSNGVWNYVDTHITNTEVSTIIPAGKYDGGKYALFEDEFYKPVLDSRLHWARKEINTFARRRYIPYGVNFRPDEKITRGELAVLLFNSLYFKYGMYQRKYFADMKEAEGIEYAIHFVLYHGLMTNAPDGRFRPRAEVAYDHIVNLSPRVGRSYYNWNTVSDKILRTKFHRSPGAQNIHLGITRAEALYYLNEYIID